MCFLCIGSCRSNCATLPDNLKRFKICLNAFRLNSLEESRFDLNGQSSYSITQNSVLFWKSSMTHRLWATDFLIQEVSPSVLSPLGPLRCVYTLEREQFQNFLSGRIFLFDLKRFLTI